MWARDLRAANVISIKPKTGREVGLICKKTGLRKLTGPVSVLKPAMVSAGGAYKLLQPRKAFLMKLFALKQIIVADWDFWAGGCWRCASPSVGAAWASAKLRVGVTELQTRNHRFWTCFSCIYPLEDV